MNPKSCRVASRAYGPLCEEANASLPCRCGTRETCRVCGRRHVVVTTCLRCAALVPMTLAITVDLLFADVARSNELTIAPLEPSSEETETMRWTGGARYIGRALGEAEVMVKEIESTGTRYVEVMLEVIRGPMATERIRYRGYINNKTNIEATVKDLRVMGWKGSRLGDWKGMGSKPLQFTCMFDREDVENKYPRAAFVQEPPTVRRGAAEEATVEDLNREHASLFEFKEPAKAPPSNPDAEDPEDDDEPRGRASAPRPEPRREADSSTEGLGF